MGERGVQLRLVWTVHSLFLVCSGFQEGRGQKQGQQIISHSACLWQEFCVYLDTWVCAIFQEGFISIQMTPLAWFQMGQPTFPILIPTQCNNISVSADSPSSWSVGAFAPSSNHKSLLQGCWSWSHLMSNYYVPSPGLSTTSFHLKPTATGEIGTIVPKLQTRKKPL